MMPTVFLVLCKSTGFASREQHGRACGPAPSCRKRCAENRRQVNLHSASQVAGRADNGCQRRQKRQPVERKSGIVLHGCAMQSGFRSLSLTEKRHISLQQETRTRRICCALYFILLATRPTCPNCRWHGGRTVPAW